MLPPPASLTPAELIPDATMIYELFEFILEFIPVVIIKMGKTGEMKNKTSQIKNLIPRRAYKERG